MEQGKHTCLLISGHVLKCQLKVKLLHTECTTFQSIEVYQNYSCIFVYCHTNHFWDKNIHYQQVPNFSLHFIWLRTYSFGRKLLNFLAEVNERIKQFATPKTCHKIICPHINQIKGNERSNSE